VWCRPKKIIKKVLHDVVSVSPSSRKISNCFLSLVFCSSLVYPFWFHCPPPVLTLDLHGIDFCFFLLSLVG
jgi:hypothetical protein